MSEAIEDEFDAYLADALKSPSFARAFKRAGRFTAIRVTRDLAWFRIRGYGLWVKYGSRPDLFTTRKTAHYWGRLRWKVLKP